MGVQMVRLPTPSAGNLPFYGILVEVEPSAGLDPAPLKVKTFCRLEHPLKNRDV